MRPTRRNFVALGKTLASADRTSSIRAREFGIPSVWFPDMEPEASNTIMASSLQGPGFFSAARDEGTLEAIRTARAMAGTRKQRGSANRMLRDCETIAQ